MKENVWKKVVIEKASIFLRFNFLQVGKRVRIIFIFLVLFSFSRSGAQGVYQTVSYLEGEIKSSLFEKSDYGHKILNSMAVTNVKGLRWVYVGIEGRILIQTEQSDDGHIFAYSKLIDYKLSGDNYYRAFNIDSLLLPSALSGTLSFLDRQDTVHAVPVEILLTGGVINLGSVDITLDSLSKLKARIEVEEYLYTREQYEAFIKAARTINFYYAYAEVLKLLVDEYTKSGINRKQASSHVFAAWHEITRVNKYVETYRFEKNLHLKTADPLGFLKTYSKSKRLEKRAGTIFDQVIETQTRGSVNEKQQYCYDYAGISKKYSLLSKNYQPYIAAGFIQVQRLFPDTLEKGRILKAETFYDVFNKLELPSTPQCIYGEFVSLAERAYDNERYVEALDYIYNASFIGNQFESVLATDSHKEIYINTLDKLMSAYLQIAIIAYRSGNFEMADNYYSKAQQTYQQHIINISNGSISPAMFLSFIEQQLELAYDFLSDNNFYEGLEMVSRADSIAGKNNLQQDDDLVDSAYSIAYLGIYQQKLDSIGMLIEANKGSQALGEMEKTDRFANEKDEYLPTMENSRFAEFAASLYSFYYDQGSYQLRSREPEEALFSFLEAQSINEKYLRQEVPELDSLIYHATVPVILHLVEKGKFEVWANRVEDARAYYEEAVSLQLKYKQEGNDTISKAILSLQAAIENQSCVNLNNSLYTLKQKTRNRLERLKYAEARNTLEEALYIIEENPECGLEGQWFTEMEAKYTEVFIFLDQKNNINMLVENKDFKQSVESYAALVNDFDKKGLDSFGLQLSTIQGFIVEAQNLELSLAASEYQLQAGDFNGALECLETARVQGAVAKDTQELQNAIATDFANADKGQGVDKKTKVLEYTKGNKWYRYFKSAYLSN